MKAFKHNCHERNSPQLKALINDVGIVSYGVYWYFLEELHEGNGIEMNTNILNSLAFIFKISVDELNVVIDAMVKHELFFKYKGKIVNEQTLENIRKRSEAGVKGAEAKWRGKKDEVLKAPEEVNKIVNFVLDKEIIALESLQPIEEIKPNKIIRKPPVKKESIQIKDFKDWQFLGVFNEVKLGYKPNSRGHTVLTKTDKQNFNALIKLGYGEDEFRKVMHIAFSNKWVQNNGMEVPDHILRNQNFTRYLSQSENKDSNNLIINESDEPTFK